MKKIFVVNPGSTSTKLSLFEEDTKVQTETIDHEKKELEQFSCVRDQLDYRFAIIRQWMEKNRLCPEELSAIAARGGLLHPLEGGTYQVNDKMMNDLSSARYGEHASNLGALLADRISEGSKRILCVIADPTCTDELEESARATGVPELPHISKYHALNQKAVARKTARSMGKTYETCNFIVAHMGGGITVGVHKQGQVVYVNNGLDGDGPFSPERAGNLPRTQLIELCYSGKYTKDQIKKLVNHNGGLMAYLGINDVRQAEQAAEDGDGKCRKYLEAMCYQIGREIGAGSAVLRGDCDAVILTGGIAYSAFVVSYIRQMVEYIAPIVICPGSDEDLALAEAALRVLNREEPLKVYE